MTFKLSPHQRDVLDLIVAAHLKHHPCPSYREMSSSMMTSIGTVASAVDVLIERGLLVRHGPPTASRSLSPTDAALREVGADVCDLSLEGLRAVVASLERRLATVEAFIERMTASEEG